MNGKRDIKIILVPILIFLVFLFGIIGYRQLLGPDFTFSGAVYCTLFYFVLNNVPHADISNNVLLLVSRYLAAITLGFGIYSLLYKHLHDFYTRLKIRYTYRNHVIVFSVKMVGVNFFSDLHSNGYKAMLVEDSSENPDLEKLKKDSVVVVEASEHDESLFDSILVAQSSVCVVAFDDDNRNIGLSLKLIRYLRSRGLRRSVRVLAHIGNKNNLEVIKDHIDISNADENFDFDIFNTYSAAAKKIYDHFPPHKYFNFGDPDDDNAIAVIGYNPAAEDFIIENIILSHYADGRNIKIYLVDRDADHVLNQFMFEYPFCREFVDIVPVKLLNNKFFANFNWSKELIEKLSKVKVVYLFGNDGAELINLAGRFRQFLNTQTLQYLRAPIIICNPEDTSLMKLLDVERQASENLTDQFRQQLNVEFVNMISDTCTSSRLLEESEYIDLLSRVINYYYSIKYDFEGVLNEKLGVPSSAGIAKIIGQKLFDISDRHVPLSEHEIETLVLQTMADMTGRNISELRPIFSIKKWWDNLSYHKKSANRYAARHLAVKLNIFQHLGCLPLSRENIVNSFSVIAPVEHKRWSAEKMMLNYRYGVMPQGNKEKSIARERLKIHDQLIPYEKLSDVEKEKDLNIFLLIPLLSALKVEIKK